MGHMTNHPFARVLVPLDGSPQSGSALRVGFAIAERANLPVTLLHVHDGTNDGVEQLSGARHRFADVAPCDAALADGPAVDAIISRSLQLAALICMASHGRSGVARLALGSVAEGVMRRNAAGTLVVGPNGASFALTKERATALLCTDGSQRAASAAPHTASLAQELGLNTLVAQQIGPDENVAVSGGRRPRRLLDAATNHCEALQRFFESQHLPADSRVLFGETSRAIVHAAHTEPATLISLASHGRTGLDRFSLGSVAAAVVRTAPCPVFVVGPASATSTTASRR